MSWKSRKSRGTIFYGTISPIASRYNVFGDLRAGYHSLTADDCNPRRICRCARVIVSLKVRIIFLDIFYSAVEYIRRSCGCKIPLRVSRQSVFSLAPLAKPRATTRFTCHSRHSPPTITRSLTHLLGIASEDPLRRRICVPLLATC